MHRPFGLAQTPYVFYTLLGKIKINLFLLLIPLANQTQKMV